MPPKRESRGPLLEFEQVSAGYPTEPEVLRGVSLDIQPGEIVALCALDMWGGKSTLLKVGAGLLAPTGGVARFDGQDIYAMGYGADQEYRRRTAVVLEGGALLVNRTIADNVGLPLQYHDGLRGKKLERKVDRLLAQAGYNESPHAYPWQVSSRGNRMAAFARALARKPELVLVDRFFEGLEMPDWKRMFELVIELNQGRGMAWLLVSELDPAIFQVADRVGLLEQGELVAYGRRSDLFADRRIEAAFHAATEGSYSGSAESQRILLVDSGEDFLDESDVDSVPLSGDGLAGLSDVPRTRRHLRTPGGDAAAADPAAGAPDLAEGRVGGGRREETVTIDGEIIRRLRREARTADQRKESRRRTLQEEPTIKVDGAIDEQIRAIGAAAVAAARERSGRLGTAAEMDLAASSEEVLASDSVESVSGEDVAGSAVESASGADASASAVESAPGADVAASAVEESASAADAAQSNDGAGPQVQLVIDPAGNEED